MVQIEAVDSNEDLLVLSEIAFFTSTVSYNTTIEVRGDPCIPNLTVPPAGSLVVAQTIGTPLAYDLTGFSNGDCAYEIYIFSSAENPPYVTTMDFDIGGRLTVEQATFTAPANPRVADSRIVEVAAGNHAVMHLEDEREVRLGHRYGGSGNWPRDDGW